MPNHFKKARTVSSRQRLLTCTLYRSDDSVQQKSTTMCLGCVLIHSSYKIERRPTSSLINFLQTLIPNDVFFRKSSNWYALRMAIGFVWGPGACLNSINWRKLSRHLAWRKRSKRFSSTSVDISCRELTASRKKGSKQRIWKLRPATPQQIPFFSRIFNGS